MANAITKFKAFIALLDEVYKQASLTADLDSDSTLVRAGANANEIIIPKISMDGLADYSRSSGYVQGDVTLTNETVTFNYDRGRKFSVDNMDNEETAGLAFGKLSSEFIRTKSAPEQDAFRFATYAGTTGISKVATGATLATGNDVLSALITAQNKMDEDEVAPENRILYITPTLYNLAINVDTTKSKAMLNGFAKIVKVPQSRFYTAIDLKDGTTKGEGVDETAGGFAKINVTLQVKHESELLAKRGLQKGGRVQQYIDSEVLRCCDSYVPFRTGKLKQSGITATVIGSGMVRYNTPYARKNYYSNNGVGNEGTKRGGKRGRLWFERMKPDHVPKILKGVKQIAGSK